MKYYCFYSSPIGEIRLEGDQNALSGLFFTGPKQVPLEAAAYNENLPVFVKTRKWLDVYFSGQNPSFTPPILLRGSSFQMSVWDRLLQIPYGHTVTYGQIARELARERGAQPVAAQAVGGAVGKNPISLIVPCHRVVGANGKLTGYAGGLDKKMYLLHLEKSV